MNLTDTKYKILYEGKNITADVSDYLLSLTYTDKATGESDEIEIEVHDKDLLWVNEWWPEKGAKISASIITDSGVLECGAFTIDEHEYKSDRASADTFSIRGMAAVITKALRTKTSTAHESKTLKELCNTVAKKHGLKVQGTIADVSISRISQYQETDLAFLARIADKYGYTFSIRDGLLIFTSTLELQNAKYVLSVDKSESLSFSFKTTSKKQAKTATVKYHNPEKQKLIKSTVTREEQIKANANFNATYGFTPTYDDIVINEPVDNEQQAGTIAKAAMQKSIVREESCELSCPGNVLIVTGNQVELTGFGRFSGIYYVIESSHTLDKAGGYVTGFTANKTGVVPKAKHKPKKGKKKQLTTDDYLAAAGEADD